MALKFALTTILTILIMLSLYHFRDTNHWIERFSVEVQENTIITTTISTLIISLLMSISVPIEPILISMAFFTSRVNDPTFDVILSLFICFNATQISTFLTVTIFRCCFLGYYKEMTHKYTIFSAFNEVAKEKGILLVVLIRLSLFLPFVLSNCLLGLTDISISSLFIGNLAVIPAQISLILFGISIYDNKRIQQELYITYIHPKYALLFFSLTVLSVLVLIYIVFQKYREITQKTEFLLKEEHLSSVPFHQIDNL
ncbi:uncharacterized protein cubi_02603 [Cryptosporidium ubiquitum]|uniref:SNARE associated Golgi protein n=1 Tax=Cryptosporidium ubiquitum TaxID=857276 RepID=A0A1J4MHA4_9CRYT|nr:uncharacterized protein cubi_02603 [Cryptosporidium ubiquitum]OII73391.1 hypothetical protein cubi_02603 [Cryptosporidium ubiquitum]